MMLDVHFTSLCFPCMGYLVAPYSPTFLS